MILCSVVSVLFCQQRIFHLQYKCHKVLRMKYFGESLFKIAVTWVEYSGFVTIEKNGTH
jgi:hypothetical protein